MSTANKLTYLNGTKQAIKQAINEDFEVIDNNTTFREYADEISSNNAKYKDLIPKETKNATNTLDISNSAGLDKALVTQYGNTYQEGEPTPDYPQEIQVVTGDNEIDICGKNIINIPNRTYTNSTISVVANDGVLTINGINSTTGNIIVEFTGINNYTTNQNITMVRNGDDISDNNAQLFLTINGTEYNMGNQTSHPDWRTLSYSGTITRLRLRIAPGASYTNFKIKPMLYLGDYDSSILFEPYKGASYPINLGNIELCKIGNYKDRIYPLNGKWYLEKQIGKVVFNGTEGGGAIYDNGQRFGYTSNNVTEIANALINTPTSVSNLTPIYSNRFTSSAQNGVTPTSNTIGFSQWGTTKYIYLSAIESTVADYKNWLSNNNVEVYFPLATPITTEITDSNYPTLYNQLNNIKLFEGVNHITMTNESGLDVEFDITYYKDWKLD